jgi:hypothetical protein
MATSAVRILGRRIGIRRRPAPPTRRRCHDGRRSAPGCACPMGRDSAVTPSSMVNITARRTARPGRAVRPSKAAICSIATVTRDGMGRSSAVYGRVGARSGRSCSQSPLPTRSDVVARDVPLGKARGGDRHLQVPRTTGQPPVAALKSIRVTRPDGATIYVIADNLSADNLAIRLPK